MVRKAFCLVVACAAIAIVTPGAYGASGVTADHPRVSAFYTTWDDYYFYAGLQVTDANVISTNSTPTSEPQQDDDVELFFETDDAHASVRTPHTFQMAVSANNGAYFSVGDNSPVPQAKAVFTYKYAASVEGTLNDSSDTDTGFTVELAIPWQEFGLSGPPASGAVWGFNAISRDRDSPQGVADKFYSLSPNVQSAADVQNPSKWVSLAFDAGDRGQKTSNKVVVSPKVAEHFPLINGSIVSGEWPSVSRISFGTSSVIAPAPTVAQEPNTTESPFTTQATTTVAPPVTAPTAPVSTTPTTTEPTVPNQPASIALPGGMSIKIVPGGIPQTPEPTPVAEAPTKQAKRNKSPLGKYANGEEPAPHGVQLTGSLQLGASSPPGLIMAAYRIDYNGDRRLAAGQNVFDSHGKTLLIDQPMDGTGPWFSGLRAVLHRRELADMRRSGIDVALIRPTTGDSNVVAEVDAVVSALNDLKAAGEDYPLVGFDVRDGAHDLDGLMHRIPNEFLAKVTGPDGTLGTLVVGTPGIKGTTPVDPASLVVVSPGGLTGEHSMAGRKGGAVYQSVWHDALQSGKSMVLIDSWNDYTSGTEIAATRQYGYAYEDQTKIQSIAFNGDREWHAKYLAYSVPQAFKPRTLYTMSLRVENAGTLPWRAGEGYSLCVRWYKDGRLFDDRSPRIPIDRDVMPGQAANVNLGVVAMNGYGEDLEPGDYVLVFDIVLGNDKWFSYAADSPLQIPVRVLGKGDQAPSSAAVLDSTLPVTIESGSTVNAVINVRNDGDVAWDDKTKLTYEIATAGTTTVPGIVASGSVPVGTSTKEVGEIVTIPVKVTALDTSGKPLAPGAYTIHWSIGGVASVTGASRQGLEIVPPSIQPSIVLSDIPREAQAGKEFTSKLAIRNLGTETWKKGSVQVGYHWYYLDGNEADWNNGTLTPLDQDVAAGSLIPMQVAKATAPDLPGRYILAWDMMPVVRGTGDAWASTQIGESGVIPLPVMVTVKGKGPAVPVDLTKYLKGDSDGNTVGEDGGVNVSLPVEMAPPDGSGEIDVNPLLASSGADQIYPSGYYSDWTGSGWQSNHGVPFRYSSTREGIACSGQRIGVPRGDYRELHVLASARNTGSDNLDLTVGSNGKGSTAHLDVVSWQTAPVLTGLYSPYVTAGDGDARDHAAYLGDYIVPLTAGSPIDTVTLPNTPNVTVYAMTLLR